MSQIDIFTSQSAEWLKAAGPESEVVISSRIRLARNLAQFPFPEKLKAVQSKKVVDLV